MKNSLKISYWAPRIICILAILFVSLFALDAFDPELTFWQQIGGFLIHLIPSFILLALLLLAWKYEYLGGLIFIFIGFMFGIIVFRMNYKMNHSIWMSIGIVASLTLPFVIAGALFMVHHFKNKSLSSH